MTHLTFPVLSPPLPPPPPAPPPANKSPPSNSQLPSPNSRFPGPQGAPGEVSNQQLSNAIAGTSANSNAVELLASDADLPTVIAKINEMLTAQRR